MLENTYHLYRDNGVEVEIRMDGFSITSSVSLTKDEYYYIRKNYIYESKINYKN